MRDRFTRLGAIAALVAAGLAFAPLHAADADFGLIDAVRAQDASQVRALLTKAVDVNVRADDGSTPLLWAAHWNDVAVADLAGSRRRRRERRQPVRHDAAVARLHQRQRRGWSNCC